MANPMSAFAQADIINACSNMASSALRTFTNFQNELATVAYTHDSFCSESSTYSSLSSSKQATFSAVYRQINRLGYGSSNASASVSESYDAFCSKHHDFESVDQKQVELVSTIHSNALGTLDLCLESAKNNVSVSFTTPAAPQDDLSITFQTNAGEQRIDGVTATNATCRHGEDILGADLATPIPITSNAVSITCTRQSAPIEMFGLNGLEYPRTQILIYTNYAGKAFEIVRPEAVTGPLQDRLSNFESEMRGLISAVSAQAGNNAARMNRLQMESRQASAGPSPAPSVACNSDEVVSTCYAYLSPSGDSLCGAAVSGDGRVCSTGGCIIPSGQAGYQLIAICSRMVKD